jgi:tetratricopeptide (TPR) repeat protein
VAGAFREAERSQARARRSGDAGHWAEARAAVEQAFQLARTSSLAHADRERFESLAAELLAEEQAASGDAARAAANRRMVEQIETIYLELGDNLDWARTSRRVEEAFREYGIDVGALDDETAAARVRASPIVKHLVTGLWYWGISLNRQQGNSGRRHLLIARRADPDPWKARLWVALDGGGRAMREFQASCDPATMDPINVEYLALMLSERGESERAIEVLRAAQSRHPDQFWITFHLARMLGENGLGSPVERMSLYSAALALRPSSTVVWRMLARARREAGDRKGALQAVDEAVRLRPDEPESLAQRGELRRELGDRSGAEEDLRASLALDPRNGRALNLLMDLLFSKGDPEDALAQARIHVRANPGWESALSLLGDGLHEVGEEEESLRCLRQAAALVANQRTATNTQEKYVFPALARALQESGRCEEAVELLEALPPPAPANRRLRAETVQLAERMRGVERRLPMLIRGEASPTDAREWIDAARIVRRRGDVHRAVGFWGVAFSMKPELAHDLEAGWRRDAARAAVHAGCQPAEGFTGEKLASFRRRGLEWLKADLDAWGERLGREGEDGLRARRAIQRARHHRDFAPVRGEEAIGKLPEEERAAWRELWKRADALVAE